MRSSRLSAPLLCGALVMLALLCVRPLAAYTVWLKDGSQIAARDKYEIKDGRAIITLPNGIQTFIDAAKIDVARTESANRGKDYGATEMGNTRVVPGTEVAAPKDKTLSDLVATHRPSSRELPTARRTGDTKASEVKRSVSGNVDFATLPHTPYPYNDVAADLRQFFHSQGLDEVGLFTGSQPNRLLLEFTTGSEGSVFQSLNASAEALLRERERFPQQVPVVEVLMKTPSHEKAGQFLLTPESAADLVAKKVDAGAFFVANVQF
jgi:hypothetical protein